MNFSQFRALGLAISFGLITTQSFAGRDDFKRVEPENENEPSPFSQVGRDILGVVFNQLSLSDQLRARAISQAFDYVGTAQWRSAKYEAFKNLESQFVSI